MINCATVSANVCSDILKMLFKEVNNMMLTVIILVIIAFYFLMQLYILPKLGIST